MLQGGSYLANIPEPGAGEWGVGLLTIISGACLLVGFLTPGAGAVAGLMTIVIAVGWTPSPVSGLLLDTVTALLVMADAAALMLLGPGAHSMDAYLFGRREIVIPHDSSRRS